VVSMDTIFHIGRNKLLVVKLEEDHDEGDSKP
jgi:hypothetical protein